MQYPIQQPVVSKAVAYCGAGVSGANAFQYVSALKCKTLSDKITDVSARGANGVNEALSFLLKGTKVIKFAPKLLQYGGHEIPVSIDKDDLMKEMETIDKCLRGSGRVLKHLEFIHSMK